MMFALKRHIPNTLTCCNLICGAIASHAAFSQNYSAAMTFIIAGAVFDFFDGFAARLLKVSSPIGKELDSLADDITFGLTPAAIVFSLLASLAPVSEKEGLVSLIPYTAFLIAAFSGIRLAKFNLDSRQSTTFIGLPTPANALFWGSLVLGMESHWHKWSGSPYLLIGLILLTCYLLVAEIPMLALKFKHFRWKGNEIRYIFILSCIPLLVFSGIAAFATIILWYVILSVITQKMS